VIQKCNVSCLIDQDFLKTFDRDIMSLFKELLTTRYVAGIGFTDIVVESLPGAIEFYETYGFEYLHGDYDSNGQTLSAYPMFLDLKKMEEIYHRATN
jgi:hypothetical protein